MQVGRQKGGGAVAMGEPGGHDGAGLWDMGLLPASTVKEGWDLLSAVL